MKRFILFFAALVSTVGVQAQLPEERGAAREGQLMLADPFILEDDGWFYIYGTQAEDGIVVYRSRDLKHWSDRCGNARNSLALHKDDVWGDFYFWAPEVYKIAEGRYLMTYSAEEHICYAESDSPCGPFVQREQRPYLGENGIDSSIFVDDDGTPYMFWVRFTAGNVIWVAEMTPDMHKVKLETARRLIDAQEGTWERIDGVVAEGPMVVKHKGKYYLTYSCNGYLSRDYAVGVAVADNVMGPYKRYEGNPILIRHCCYYGTGHHALLRTSRGKLYIVYHAHYDHKKVHPRQTLIAPLRFRRDRSGGKNYYRLEVSDKIIVPMVEKVH